LHWLFTGFRCTFTALFTFWEIVFLCLQLFFICSFSRLFDFLYPIFSYFFFGPLSNISFSNAKRTHPHSWKYKYKAAIEKIKANKKQNKKEETNFATPWVSQLIKSIQHPRKQLFCFDLHFLYAKNSWYQKFYKNILKKNIWLNVCYFFLTFSYY